MIWKQVIRDKVAMEQLYRIEKRSMPDWFKKNYEEEDFVGDR